MIKIYIFLILFIIYIIYIIYNYKISHTFWNKQKVSYNYFKKGIISKSKYIPLSIGKYKIKTNINIKKIYNLLKNNYLKGYKYNISHLEQLFGETTLNIYNNNILIGNITSNNIYLQIDNIKVNFGYVDFLCVHKKYRGNKIAPILISNLISKYPNDYCFIFKKEINKLPFDITNQFNYYYKKIINRNIININLEDVNKYNINKCFNIFKKYSKTFKVHIFYETITDFIKQFPLKNSIIKLITNSNDIFIGFLNINMDNNLKVAEILFLIIPKNIEKNLLNFFQYLFNNNYDYCVITNLSNNKIYIDLFDFKIGNNCYLHMYNYGFNKQLNTNEIFLPLP